MHPSRHSTASRPTALALLVAVLATGLSALGLATTAAPAGAAPPACTIAWLGNTGSWSDPNQWRTIPGNNPAVPNTGDTACITASGTYTVTNAVGVGGGNSWLVLGGSSGTQTLQVAAGMAAGGNNNAIGARGVVSLAAAGSEFGVGNGGEFTNAGVIESVGPGTGARTLGINNTTLFNTGTIRATAPLDISGGNLQNDGTITTTAPVQRYQGGLRANSGTIAATGAGRFDFVSGARLVVTSVGVSGPVRMDGGTVEVLGAGPLNLEAYGTATLVGDLRAGQTITVTKTGIPTGHLQIDDSAVNNGTIVLRDAATQITVPPGAGNALTNRGTISAPGSAVDRHIYRGFVNDTSGVVDVAGYLDIDPSCCSTGFTNRGAINVTGTLNLGNGPSSLAGGTIAATGSGTVTAYQTALSLAGGAVTGTPVSFTTGGSVAFGGSAAATVRATSGITVSGTVAANQVLEIAPDRSATTPSGGTFTNNGAIRLLGGGSVGNPAGTVVNNGTVTNTTCCPELQGRWTNNGTITVPAGGVSWRADEGFRSFTNAGTIDLAAGTQMWTTNFTQTGAGRVISRITAPSTRGLLTVQGAATLAGQLRTVTTGTPPTGTTVTPITFESRTGTVTPTNGGGVGWTAAHGATSVVLTVSATTPSESFVKAAYQDFLNRQPTASELSTTAAALDAGTASRASVVRSLSTSPEYVTALVQRLYLDTLGRPGDSGGVAYWVEQLRTGRRSVAQVAASFYASPEYFTGIGGGTNQTWVRDLYVKLLGRAADAEGTTYWVGQTVATSRTDVAFRFYQSLESRRTWVTRLYQALLGRAPDTDGRDYWAGRITTEGDLALAANLASSAEYATRARTRYP